MPSDPRGGALPRTLTAAAPATGPPKELTCPITHELLRDPVVADDGHTYERDAVTKWLASGNARSPVTNEELPARHALVPNHALKAVVESYASELGLQLVRACDQPEIQLSELISLIERGAALETRDPARAGETALHALVRRGQPDLALLLIERGADASLHDDRGETPSRAARRRRVGDEKFVEALEAAEGEAEARRERERELRARAQEAYRLTQERRRAEQRAQRDQASRDARNGAGGGLMPGHAFFPSLFGLQFLSERVARSHASAEEVFLVSQTHEGWWAWFWLRLRLVLGYCRRWFVVDSRSGGEDWAQQRVLSRALLTLGCTVLICLLIL